MKKSVENSQAQADILSEVLFKLIELDDDYLREVAKDMMKDAHFKASASVLNPNYSHKEIEILQLKAKCITALSEVIEIGKKIREANIDNLKEKLHRKQMAKFF